MELVVYIDFASAQARLALNPTRRLAGETGVALDWRPFPPRPGPPRDADPQSRSARHRRIRADYRRREESFYAEHQGISLVYPAPSCEGFAANAGLAWLRERHGAPGAEIDAYVADVFERVWSGAMDPSDRNAALAAIAGAHGDTEGFDAWYSARAGAALQGYRQQALEQGVVDVPGYVVQGEPFIGRANLPIVRRLLSSFTPDGSTTTSLQGSGRSPRPA